MILYHFLNFCAIMSLRNKNASHRFVPGVRHFCNLMRLAVRVYHSRNSRRRQDWKVVFFMRELFKEHIFEAKVRDVHDFIIDSLHFFDEEQEDYPGLSFDCVPRTDYIKAASKSAKKTPYYIMLNVQVSCLEQTNVVDSDVAEIKFTRLKANKTKAELYLETDSQRWFKQDKQNWDMPVDFGISCLASSWQDLIDLWNKPHHQDTPPLQNGSDLVRREFIFDTTPRNFEKILKKCSQSISFFSSCDWESMVPKEGVELELVGFYKDSVLDEIDGVIKIQVSHYSSEQIQVLAENNTLSNSYTKFFDELMIKLDRLGKLWLKDEAEITHETINDKRSDYQPEEVIELIQNGVFDGCGMEKETAIATVKAILWLAENTDDKLTVQAIADKANYQREHYYSFRKGCIQAGIEKIKSINVITVRKNN